MIKTSEFDNIFSSKGETPKIDAIRNSLKSVKLDGLRHYKAYLKAVIQQEKEKEFDDPNVELDLPESVRVIHGEELNGNDG